MYGIVWCHTNRVLHIRAKWNYYLSVRCFLVGQSVYNLSCIYGIPLSPFSASVLLLNYLFIVLKQYNQLLHQQVIKHISDIEI